jgi:rhodanese-related sulfurtransferase
MMAETIADFLIERLIEWGVARITVDPGDGINGITAALLRHEGPTISRRCGPPWSKRRGERTFCARPGAVRNEGGAVVKEISREELKAKMDRGDDFVLVAALSRRHYESSHLPGAINLPYEFVDEAERVLPDKRADIVVYCMNEGCEASREEVRELEEMGYRHVLYYLGGKEDLPVEGRREST